MESLTGDGRGRNSRAALLYVEEFIPTDNVDAMPKVADAALRLWPQQKKSDEDDLRRSMVWMKKYIAPTSEYWQWKSFDEPIGQNVRLQVSFVGLGWLVGLSQAFDSSTVDLLGLEREMVEMLDQITAGIPVEGLLRLKASPWENQDLDELCRYLNARQSTESGARVTRKGGSTREVVLGNRVRLTLSDDERLYAPELKAGLDTDIRSVLTSIKEWTNGNRHYEGADWCAFKRRRLTVVVKEVRNEADLDPDEADFDFTSEPSGLYTRQSPRQFDRVTHERAGGNLQSTVVFPLYPFHLGVLNPRVVIRACTDLSGEEVQGLRRYYSYLWVNHYTRLWRYLQFEDQFAYTSDVRRLRELDDPNVLGYTRRLLEADELRAGLEHANRIDAGDLAAYQPPHHDFGIVGSGEDPTSAAYCLRRKLISSGITALGHDPLQRAPAVLGSATTELIRTYTNFSQAASLRMQRSLQILQFLFIIAAVAQILALLPISDVAAQATIFLLRGFPWYDSVASWKESIPWLRNTPLIAYAYRIVLLVALSFAFIRTIRSDRLRSILRRLLG